MNPENNFISFEIKNEILFGRYNEVFVDINIAKSVLESRNIYTNEKSYPMVVDCSLLKGVDKEARDFFSQTEGSQGLKASALIVKSRFNAFFVNFLIKVHLHKTDLPVKMFYNLDDAILWLEQYK